GYDANDPFSCTPGAQMGIEPATGKPPAAMVDDNSSSSPVVLPNGAVLYGALTGYNDARGHLLRFTFDGRFTGSYDFGWDTTPAVHGDTIIIKDNHYGPGPYSITGLDAALS